MLPTLATVTAALGLSTAMVVRAAPSNAILGTNRLGARIVGGENALPGEFPFIVTLISSMTGYNFCGGVLIDKHTVLTAAHCATRIDASKIKIRAGSLLWASGGVEVGVASSTVHPSYISQENDNDVAILHLQGPIETASQIRYAMLPAPGSDPAVGATVMVAGWGDTSSGNGTFPDSLQKVSVSVISRAVCKSLYAGVEPIARNTVTENMFCAGVPDGGKDSCHVDSGGPIVDASTRVLLGVVSWGGKECADKRYPGVYVRLADYVDWINSTMSQNQGRQIAHVMG